MDLEIELDNRRAEWGVYVDERQRFIRDGMSAEFMAGWDAWGASVAAKKTALEAQLAIEAPAPDLPTAVITPVEDSTACGVITVSPEEDL